LSNRRKEEKGKGKNASRRGKARFSAPPAHLFDWKRKKRTIGGEGGKGEKGHHSIHKKEGGSGKKEENAFAAFRSLL